MQRRFSYIGLIILILSGIVVAAGAVDPPEIGWAKCLGGTSYDIVYSVQQTADGGYIVAGKTESNDGDVNGNHGEADMWVVKLDETGILVWQRCLGGISDDGAYSVQQTADGGYIVAGYTNSNDGDVSGNHGGNDFWVVKLDSTGNIIWQKCLGGTSGDGAYSVQQTADGGYIVAGGTRSNDGDVGGYHGNGDSWVVKLDDNGNLMWQRCLGGLGSDSYQNSIQQTTDGGYIVAGRTESIDGDVIGNHGASDMWVVKLDSNGGLIWQRCLGGTSSDAGFSGQQTTDGGYIIAGYTCSNDGDVSGSRGNDVWVVKLDSNGNFLWQQCIGEYGSEYGYAIQQSADEGYIVTGLARLDLWVVKLDNTGSLVWQQPFGGTSDDSGASLRQTKDGGYIIAGYTESNDGDVSG